MDLALEFPNLGKYYVQLPNVTNDHYQRIYDYFAPLINSNIKSREAIAMAFIYALDTCPQENPSDIWHHIIYRIYLREKIGTNPEQSWVRTSGEAFEITISNKYNPLIENYGIRLKTMFLKKDKIKALEKMEILNLVGSSKIDVVVEKYGAGFGIGHDGYGIIGGLHCKTSLAERVSDDIPASRIMMERGLISLLVTLDVKSFPPPHGDLVNRGELGTPENPSDKRNYIEEHGDFDACFSFNTRTIPSNNNTRSGKRIYVIKPGHTDYLLEYLLNI